MATTYQIMPYNTAQQRPQAATVQQYSTQMQPATVQGWNNTGWQQPVQQPAPQPTQQAFGSQPSWYQRTGAAAVPVPATGGTIPGGSRTPISQPVYGPPTGEGDAPGSWSLPATRPTTLPNNTQPPGLYQPQPITPSQPGTPATQPGWPYTAPSPWDYTTPAPGGYPAGTPTQYIPWQTPQNDQEWDWFRQNSQEMAAWLPYGQFLQNQQQYSQDFNEAQRRWDAQMGWTQQTDTFNMGLSGRQQEMAEWQAQEAARQWNSQFDWTQQTDQWSNELAQRQTDIDEMYRTGQITNQQREIALAELTQQQGNQLANRQQDWTQQYQGGQLELQQQANQIEQAWRSGQLSNEQRQIALAEVTQRQNFGLAQTTQQQNYQLQQQANQIEQAWRTGQLSNEQRQIALAELTQRQNVGLQQQELGLQAQELASRDWYQRSQADVANRQTEIDAMYRSGQISNEQRQIALAELTQRQGQAYQYAELSQQGGLQSRELDLKDWYQRSQADVAQQQMQIDAMYRSGQISNQQREIALAEVTQRQSYGLAQQQFGWQQQLAQLQMAQEAALSRERMQSEQKMAAMSAFGRSFAPNVRAIRSW